jgi:hypothetical protein
VNAQQPMRGWYPDPFGRYDERYFIDGHFTDRTRLFLGARTRTFRDPVAGAIEIETLEPIRAPYQASSRLGTVALVCGGVGVVCVLIGFVLGAFVHVHAGDNDVDCGTAFSPANLSRAATRQCNSVGLTANRTAATLLLLAGIGLLVFAVVRTVGMKRLSLWGSGGAPETDLSLDAEQFDGGDTRVCPWCAETIKSAAVICRFCGRVTPSASETGRAGADGFVFDPRRGAWTRVDVAARAGDAGVAEPLFELPARPTALPRPVAPTSPDVIDVDEDSSES